MIDEIKINWSDRHTTRKKLKQDGFISQSTVKFNYPDLILKKFRKTLNNPKMVEAIKLNTSGAVTYWYDENLDFCNDNRKFTAIEAYLPLNKVVEDDQSDELACPFCKETEPVFVCERCGHKWPIT